MTQQNAWLKPLGSTAGSLIGSMWGPIGSWAGGQIGGDISDIAGNAFSGNWKGIGENLAAQLQKGMDPMKALGLGGEEEPTPQPAAPPSPLDTYNMSRLADLLQGRGRIF